MWDQDQKKKTIKKLKEQFECCDGENIKPKALSFENLHEKLGVKTISRYARQQCEYFFREKFTQGKIITEKDIKTVNAWTPDPRPNEKQNRPRCTKYSIDTIIAGGLSVAIIGPIIVNFILPETGFHLFLVWVWIVGYLLVGFTNKLGMERTISFMLYLLLCGTITYTLLTATKPEGKGLYNFTATESIDPETGKLFETTIDISTLGDMKGNMYPTVPEGSLYGGAPKGILGEKNGMTPGKEFQFEFNGEEITGQLTSRVEGEAQQARVWSTANGQHVYNEDLVLDFFLVWGPLIFVSLFVTIFIFVWWFVQARNCGKIALPRA